ncbi:MAG: hypothetical protein H0W88_05780 [Parachlamydiaceae bacterium]|nr:hypothetical protein [Parachlamydiaceae bacterium]
MTTTTKNISSTFDIVNPKYKPLVYAGVIATGLAVGAVFVPIESIKIIGLTVLTGVSYGIANDMIACRDCIEYFTVGHKYDGLELRNRPLKTLNPNLNAIVWGMIATWHVCSIAGSFFALIARYPFRGLALKISAVQLAPYLAFGATLTVILAHVNARIAQKLPFSNWRVPHELQAGWEACNARNLTGYVVLGIGGIALSVAMIAARARLIRL